MKYKGTVVSIALIMANSAWAQDEAYYSITDIEVVAEGANYGPFPSAMSTDADGNEFIATYSMKASLSASVDVGLPFTFNRACQYDYMLCELEFYGSETAGDLNYYNAYQKWRNAQSSAESSYVSYMMGNTLSGTADNITDNGVALPFDGDNTNTTDVKVTDVYMNGDGVQYVIGYSSAQYISGQRDFVRRAFIQSLSDNTVTELPPNFTTYGGFSSAYKIQEVNGRVFVIGAASVSFPENDDEYFNRCYNSDEYDELYGMNELVYCPGFDTQAWAWDVTELVAGNETADTLPGTALATQWLDENTSNQNDLTYSANAFDMNALGTAVGASTFEEGGGAEGGRQRAIIMTPTDSNYGIPFEITAAIEDIGDTGEQESLIYNTWALSISEAGIVTGNREYNTSKGVNFPTEFFVYDSASKAIKIPFLDKKVATTKQRLENSGNYYVTKRGANSRVYDANESNMIVGEVDDFDQTDPVENGKPRNQAAFLYDSEKEQAWLMNDLICTQSTDADGVTVVESRFVRIHTARVINDEGVILADGFKYSSAADYQNKVNGVETAFKLTRNSAVLSPNESPNCWESDLLNVVDEPYEREGGATFWFWLFALPLVFIRRFMR